MRWKLQDINGTPTTLEKAINEWLMRSKLVRRYLVPYFGERLALQAAGNITSSMTYLCLGYFSMSSALLNFSQAINTAAYLGDASAIVRCIAKGAHRKYSMHDLKILVETNVLNDIGLDSGSGYDKNRMSAKHLLGRLNKAGMGLFKLTEGIVRRGTVLAAYEKARKEGKTHEAAIAFAKEVNRKSNFDYGAADAPNVFRRGSVVSQLALQFKKYGIKEMEVVADMFPTNPKTSRKQKAIFWGYLFLTAGLMGLPMLAFLDEWPFDKRLRLSVEECVFEAAGSSPVGQFLAKTALFGLASSTVGIDLSNRAGLADVIPTRTSDLVGPTLSKSYQFVGDLFKGDHAAALRDVSPGLYNQYAAWIAGRSTERRGRTNQSYDSFYAKVLRAMGFKSTEERVESDVTRILRRRRIEETQQKQEAVDAYLDEPSAEHEARLRELGVKPQAVEAERERKGKERLERSVEGQSKAKRETASALLDFAR